MKKTLLALFAGLFVACGTLFAETYYVSESEMERIVKAANAYSERAKKYAADAEKVSDLNEHIALSKDVISFLETDPAIKDAPADLKNYLDAIRVRMGQVVKFIQDTPNWKRSEEEWQKKLNQISNSIDAKEKEMGEYLKSCKVKKGGWRIPRIFFWLIGALVVGAITSAYNKVKK